MAPGIVLIIVGAVFAFAIKAESSWLDVRVLGVILMLGGLGFIVRSRTKRREVVLQETESGTAGAGAEQTRVVERRVE